MFKRIKASFFTGLVIILPLLLTIAIFAFLVRQINEKILAPVIMLLGLESYAGDWVYLIKIMAFFITIFLIALIGAATRFLLLRNFFSFWENILFRVPIVGKIYLSIKEISRAFLGHGKAVFEQVVLIEYPRKGIYSLAFLTHEASKEIKQKTEMDGVYVFLPTTPNPTNGFFLVVPKEEIIPLKMSVEDGLKLVVSGGTVSPPDRNN